MEEASEKEGKTLHILSELFCVSVIAGLKAPSRRTAVPKASMGTGLQALPPPGRSPSADVHVPYNKWPSICIKYACILK